MVVSIDSIGSIVDGETSCAGLVFVEVAGIGSVGLFAGGEVLSGFSSLKPSLLKPFSLKPSHLVVRAFCSSCCFLAFFSAANHQSFIFCYFSSM